MSQVKRRKHWEMRNRAKENDRNSQMASMNPDIHVSKCEVQGCKGIVRMKRYGMYMHKFGGECPICQIWHSFFDTDRLIEMAREEEELEGKNCYSFDIDGTMLWGGGIIPSWVVKKLKSLGHVIIGGSDHPEVTQRSEFQMNGIELDSVPMKSGLGRMKEAYPDCEHYYHIGDDETDIMEAKEAGFTYLTPEAFLKKVCEGGLIG